MKRERARQRSEERARCAMAGPTHTARHGEHRTGDCKAGRGDVMDSLIFTKPWQGAHCARGSANIKRTSVDNANYTDRKNAWESSTPLARGLLRLDQVAVFRNSPFFVTP